MADAHWRYTANTPRIGPIDARAFSPFPMLLMWKSVIPLAFGFFFIFFFAIIQRKGYDFPTFCRALRTKISSPTKGVRPLR
ncbi:IcmT/TraK family protein [Ralstonia sp. ASV6]|uniref:IcmT/TraK family protein n=1 Tax=Ralstonia sp. ASV6 TaxID=2795124 RepID=UPI0018EC3356|nr:IcmT/TraK family protein [Ralstonia sp. ASV6]